MTVGVSLLVSDLGAHSLGYESKGIDIELKQATRKIFESTLTVEA